MSEHQAFLFQANAQLTPQTSPANMAKQLVWFGFCKSCSAIEKGMTCVVSEIHHPDSTGTFSELHGTSFFWFDGYQHFHISAGQNNTSTQQLCSGLSVTAERGHVQL